MLLGLADEAVLNGFRKGVPLPGDNRLLERVSHLLSIYKYLQILYPENPHVRTTWLYLNNGAFQGMTPLEFVRVNGISGLRELQLYLQSRCYR